MRISKPIVQIRPLVAISLNLSTEPTERRTKPLRGPLFPLCLSIVQWRETPLWSTWTADRGHTDGPTTSFGESGSYGDPCVGLGPSPSESTCCNHYDNLYVKQNGGEKRICTVQALNL